MALTAVPPWHRRVDAGLGLLLSQLPQPGAANGLRDALRIAAGELERSPSPCSCAMPRLQAHGCTRPALQAAHEVAPASDRAGNRQCATAAPRDAQRVLPTVWPPCCTLLAGTRSLAMSLWSCLGRPAGSRSLAAAALQFSRCMRPASTALPLLSLVHFSHPPPRLALPCPLCAVMHPPLAALVLHAFVTAMSWNPAYCTTPLLAAPLVRQRQVGLARLLDWASMPLAAVQPITVRLPRWFAGAVALRAWALVGCALLAHAACPSYLDQPAAAPSCPRLPCLPDPADERARCLATTSWFHITVQLIGPLLYNVWLWRPPPPTPQEPAVPGSCSGLVWSLRRAVGACDRGLHHVLCGGAPHGAVRVAVAYYILANAWLLCRV